MLLCSHPRAETVIKLNNAIMRGKSMFAPASHPKVPPQAIFVGVTSGSVSEPKVGHKRKTRIRIETSSTTDNGRSICGPLTKKQSKSLMSSYRGYQKEKQITVIKCLNYGQPFIMCLAKPEHRTSKPWSSNIDYV